ncbi:membrane protein [Marivirga lumbricoides]|uniref:Membrane protein n=1 Tax=Marivirga lumbricoides TaxID=1046115 RepID=A0ABQ1M2D3_9BACT|nr:membrane protein [Marivirga lumbricoides]
MIQRIQTVFLLLVGIAMLVFLFAPIWQKQEINTAVSYTQTAFYMEKVTIEEEGVQNTFMPYAIPGILGIISVCIAFITIGLYKKRMKQIILCAVNSIVIGVALGLSAYWATQAESNILQDIQGGYQYGLFLPAIAIVFNSLAGRFIRKDERLVRSMDRLR